MCTNTDKINAEYGQEASSVSSSVSISFQTMCTDTEKNNANVQTGACFYIRIIRFE